MKTFKELRIKRILIPLFIVSFISVAAYGQDPPADSKITNAVDEELMFNTTTPSYLLDVSTIDGIVTLSGSVDNILAKERAEKIAGTVKGVRGVINKITVDAPDIPDEKLRKDVRDALLYDPATDSYELEVIASDSEITLTGTVDSWNEKRLAGYVAKGVDGVVAVDNNIEINYKTDRPDMEIMEEVEAILRNDIRVDNALIDVSVDGGEVILSGTVGSLAEKYQAEADAWVAGVSDVNTEGLEVKEWARNENMRSDKYVRKTDEEIREAVENAFLYDPRVNSFNINAEVENGIVTLTGAVDSPKARKSAEADAKNVVGVFSVKNYLKVRPVVIPPDNQLRSDLTNALLRDPYVEKFEIDIAVDNGVVTLDGAVDTYFEKVQAEDVISRVKGVVAVNNNITVMDDYDYYQYDYYGWNTYYPPYYYNYGTGETYQTDWEIREDIESQLWWSPYVNQDEVSVVVLNGEATLTGTVDTEREKLFAEINALEGGATSVDNNLDVRYTPSD